MDHMLTKAIVALALISFLPASASANVCEPTAQLYNVVGVETWDTLNVRSGPSTKFEVIDELEPDSTGIRTTGQFIAKTDECLLSCTNAQTIEDPAVSQCFSKGNIWYEIEVSSALVGWASAKHLVLDENSPLQEEIVNVGSTGVESDTSEQVNTIIESSEAGGSITETFADPRSNISEPQETRILTTDNLMSLITAESSIPEDQRVGFRDFRIGMPKEVAEIYISGETASGIENKLIVPELRKCSVHSFGHKCYGLDYEFVFVYKGNKLSGVDLYLGDYVSSGSFFADLVNSATGDDPFVSNFNSLKKKYSLSYTFSENDRVMFNSGKRQSLSAIFEEGRIALELIRIYNGDLKILVAYRDEEDARKFLDASKPKVAPDEF